MKEHKTGTFIMGRCTVVTTQDANNHWRMIISKREGKPSYKEVVKARYKYLPDEITMVQIFPPKEEFEQIGNNAHFLFQIIK